METNVVNKFLLISIDCWRYDALESDEFVSQYTEVRSANAGFFARRKVFSWQHQQRVPPTPPILRGLYPFEHGVYGQTYLKMFEGIPNLFQIFSDTGYHITGRSERPDVFRFLDYRAVHYTSVDPNAAGTTTRFA